MTGAIREESFNPSAKFENGTVERRNAEYSYNDGDLYYFMDPETYDMTPLNKDVLGDGFQFVKENTMCTSGQLQGQRVQRGGSQLHGAGSHCYRARRREAIPPPTSPSPPPWRPAPMIKVPLFINEGDKIQVDTRTGEYLGRVKE